METATEPPPDLLVDGTTQSETQKDAATTASDGASTKAVKDFPAFNEELPARAADGALNSTAQPQGNMLDNDAALASRSGITATGANKALEKKYDFDDPSPYSSRTLDPRVDLIAQKIPGAWPRGDSYQSEVAAPQPAASTEPESKVRDFGDPAAVVGGVGAAGLGVHEIEKDHAMHHPTADVNTVTGGNTVELTKNELEQPAHQYERGATAVSGLGAAGLGAHEAEKHLKNEESVPELTSPATSTVNPEQHISSVEPNQVPQANESEQHYGRDATIAGGAGAASLGAYEAHKHHEQSKPAADPATTVKEPAAAPHNGFVYTGDFAPVNAQPTAAQPEQQQHHHGRDAALAGGAGAVGLGAYEAEKDREAGKETQEPAPAARDSALAVAPNKAQEEQHYGRDAAVTGGTGAAAYEADKHFGHIDKKAREERLPVEYEASQTIPDSESTYSQTDAAPFIARETEVTEPQHHYGQDAAMAGGAGAALWFANDEIEKKHKHKDSMDLDLDIMAHMRPRYDDQRAEMHHHLGDDHPGFAVAGEALPAAKELGGNNIAADSEAQHHYGRDAAIAGGLGLTGVGAYEAHSQLHDDGAAPAPGQAPPIDADSEYVRQQQLEQQQQDGVTPHRSHTHSRKSSKEERKHGSVLGKIFHRRSRVGMRDGSNSPPGAAVEDEPQHNSSSAAAAVTTSPAAAAGIATTATAGANDNAAGTASSPVPDARDLAAEPVTPTRSPTEKRGSPKQHAAEFAHLGRNRLHKEPTKKYLRKQRAAQAAAEVAAAASSPSSGGSAVEGGAGAYGEGLEEGSAYRGVEQGGEGPGGYRGNAWEGSNVHAEQAGGEQPDWVNVREHDVRRT